ncbi:MAG: pyrimidine-nucleoside phosphorylase [Bacillota bacterium]
MNIYDIILKKRQGGELDPEEIEFFINGYVAGIIPDYQISALLMAIFLNGLSQRETIDLTMKMFKSGDIIDLSSIPGIKVDKHSTGGVGDKTTIVLGPLVASAGVKVAKMSGRGLGHTGGTIDKLEAIPGFKVELNNRDFLSQVKEIGLAVVAQTGNLVPADKKLYALRDVTATVDNISLIASSIMSKKLASGADAVVLDVKVGVGAFMKDVEAASELASLMVDIGNSLNRTTVAVITTMDQPLGFAVGNSLEVKEAIDTLAGRGPSDLMELCISLGSEMLVLAGKANSVEEASQTLEENIKKGHALVKFGEMIARQGGNYHVIYDTGLLPEASQKTVITSVADGYIKEIDALKIGYSAMKLGAGRETKDSKLDLSAGILLHKKVGDRVYKGEPLATLHYNSGRSTEIPSELVKQSFVIGEEKPFPSPLIIKKIK